MGVTIKDVARKSGYSITTVSYALNGRREIPDKTKEKINSVAKELNYVPSAYASTLKRQKSFNIGVFVADFDGPVHQTIISGISKGINEAKSPYKLFATVAKSSMDMIKSKIVDLAIIMDSRVSNSEVIEMAKIVPVITFDKKIEGANIYYTDMTNFEGVYDAVDKLFHKGARRIAYLLGPERSYHNQMRFNGYKKALVDLKLDFNKNIVFNANLFIEDAGYKTINDYLDHNDLNFDSLICANDELAIGAMRALSEHKINVPRDVMVCGFDNIMLAHYTNPTLSTVSVDWLDYGRKIAKYAIDILSNKVKNNEPLIIETSFVERESTE